MIVNSEPLVTKTVNKDNNQMLHDSLSPKSADDVTCS